MFYKCYMRKYVKCSERDFKIYSFILENPPDYLIQTENCYDNLKFTIYKYGTASNFCINNFICFRDGCFLPLSCSGQIFH